MDGFWSALLDYQRAGKLSETTCLLYQARDRKVPLLEEAPQIVMEVHLEGRRVCGRVVVEAV